MLNKFAKVIAFWSSLLMVAFIVVGLVIIPIIFYMSQGLPDYNQLMDYDPPTISRIFSSEGKLMAELAAERRIFKRIDEMPEILKKAFIAAEDKNFYSHQGIDVTSIMRAAFQNLSNVTHLKGLTGGSTITQQVVKNFLLTNEQTIARKVKEAILAYRISQIYTKDRILELYLNQIYLGNGAYGVAMASLGYFNKDMKDLTIEEVALLAAMPKAPSNLSQAKNLEKAQFRRNWVIDRMQEENFITLSQATLAKTVPIKLNARWDNAIQDNGYYNEAVRIDLVDHFGYDYVYKEGITVHTNINKDMQKYADEALRDGLINYDRKHGYRGGVGKVVNLTNWKQELQKAKVPEAIGSWKLAVVLSIANDSASIGLLDGSKSTIPLTNLTWARKALKDGYIGKPIESAKEVLSLGDVILVDKKLDQHTLEQIPEVNGGLIAIQPKTGKVLAMVGGFSFKESKYNRVMQAMRQPGSAFKPFVYLTALEEGYQTTSLINDEPMSISLGAGQELWVPRNYDGKFLGQITLRQALEKSRNIPTVKLITNLGIKSVADTATRLGVYDKTPPLHYSMALGAVETTPLKITGAFSVFASNGMMIRPRLIDRIQDRKGNIIYSSEDIVCDFCKVEGEGQELDPEQVPHLSYRSKYVVDPVTNYQMVSLLEGVVQRGTGVRAKAINKTVALKTGTSNESFDTWTIGFSPDIVCGVFVGFDNPRTLGKKEQGSSVALPIFVDFMQKALVRMPNRNFEVPEGITFIDVDSAGKPIDNSKNAIKEPLTEQQYSNMVMEQPSNEDDNNDESQPFNNNDAPDEVFE